MANLNKVMLIGRLTRDVEVRSFSNGGKVAKFGFAVTGQRKKNPQTGKWEDEPCFLDVEVFNRGETGRSADLAEQYLAKGRQVFIEGHLRMDSWTSQDGQKRNKLVVVAENFQFLEPKGEGGGSAGGGSFNREGGGYANRGGSRSSGYETPPDDGGEPAPSFAPDQDKEDIPF
jgi:single-strand DNA-binding protein